MEGALQGAEEQPILPGAQCSQAEEWCSPVPRGPSTRRQQGRRGRTPSARLVGALTAGPRAELQVCAGESAGTEGKPARVGSLQREWERGGPAKEQKSGVCWLTERSRRSLWSHSLQGWRESVSVQPWGPADARDGRGIAPGLRALEALPVHKPTGGSAHTCRPSDIPWSGLCRVQSRAPLPKNLAGLALWAAWPPAPYPGTASVPVGLCWHPGHMGVEAAGETGSQSAPGWHLLGHAPAHIRPARQSMVCWFRCFLSPLNSSLLQAYPPPRLCCLRVWWAQT